MYWRIIRFEGISGIAGIRMTLEHMMSFKDILKKEPIKVNEQKCKAIVKGVWAFYSFSCWPQ